MSYNQQQHQQYGGGYNKQSYYTRQHASGQQQQRQQQGLQQQRRYVQPEGSSQPAPYQYTPQDPQVYSTPPLRQRSPQSMPAPLAEQFYEPYHVREREEAPVDEPNHDVEHQHGKNDDFEQVYHDDENEEEEEEYEDDDKDEGYVDQATWEEVFEACCVHTPHEWLRIFLAICLLCFFLYFFLLGLDLLSSSAKVVGGCTAGSLLGDTTNPVAGLMIGILATVLLQSSSTATSIIVSLVAGDAVSTRQAIYMVMGANIGTSVTNTIVAMGYIGHPEHLENAFGGATVHDMFNFMSTAVLLPLEATTGYLYHVTKALLKPISLRDGEKWTGPVKRLVSPLGSKIIIANKDVITDVAKGGSCESSYPIFCEDPSNPSSKSCNQTGLITCDKKTGECPFFFQVSASDHDDKLSGGVCFILALLILIFCLAALITILQKLLLGISARIVYRATNINGYLAMVIGTGITILVQSSSITTSTLTPLVGVGVVSLEQMYSLTLGCNIGTTVTALLAALVSDKVESLQVALAHLLCNITGILIWYPIPFMRQIPIGAARRLGQATQYWRGFPIVYILCMFFLLPLSLLGVASLFDQNSLGYDVLGAVLVIVLGSIVIYIVYWWQFRDGRKICVRCLHQRDRRREALADLPTDVEMLKKTISRLEEFVGMVEGDKEVHEAEEEKEEIE